MNEITPVLLAGGYGNRLWPLSRKSYPKQFQKIFGGTTLFQQSALRSLSSDIINFKPHITLTNWNFRFIVSEQLQEIGIDPKHIMIEPDSKNTAPAILASSLFAYKDNEDAILLVAPSDHIISNNLDFHKIIQAGLYAANEGKIVTFGISPDSPETGFGYIEVMGHNSDQDNKSNVKKFIEKPNKSLAEQMLISGNFFWNAGIFLFRAKDMINAFEKFSPEILINTKKALNYASIDLGFLCLNEKYWKLIEGISIDYAIMEKIENLFLVPFKSKWSDLGSWKSVWENSDKDKFGVGMSDNANAFDCKNTLIRSENKNQHIVGIGLENIIAIAMPDAVLVAHKDKCQEIKNALEHLKIEGVNQVDKFSKEHRPWGCFESLYLSDLFHVKIIHVKPGESLSLQSHKFRSEHWVVIEGIAKVTVGDKILNIKSGESIYIPSGQIHRLENCEKRIITLVEVQTGSYFGEDDIVRYDDKYARNDKV